MSDQLLDILDGIKAEGEAVATTDETNQSAQTSEPVDAVTLENLRTLKKTLVDLSGKAQVSNALETIKSQKTLDKTTALEVFTMLPGYGPYASGRFTNAPSAHNRDLLLNAVSVDTNYVSQYIDYIGQIYNAVYDKCDLYDKLVSSCKVYLDIQAQVLPKLLDSSPMVVLYREKVKLLETDIERLAYTDFDESIEYPKYEGVLNKYYKEILNNDGFNKLKQRKAYKSIKDGETVGVTVKDVIQYLSDTASYIATRSSEMDVIKNNLLEMQTNVGNNPAIPSGYFEGIFDVLENTMESYSLFYPENSVANAVLKLLKFLD